MRRKLIPFQIETKRVLKLLATQIYQSPLALLRENAQNAYDAILVRLRREPDIDPYINIVLSPNRIVITDNGIGMTPDELRSHYWRAGSSGKNTKEARAAGVVGTFGIGAMANFGIANEIIVETESAVTFERTRSRAILERLSLNEDCIELETLASRNDPGTTVIASISSSRVIDVMAATEYIKTFMSLLQIPVMVNQQQISGVQTETIVRKPSQAWTYRKGNCQIGPRLSSDVELVLSQNADIWINLTNLVWSLRPIKGSLALRSGVHTLRTFRSNFGLATTAVESNYRFGGVANLQSLQPTAGREALTTNSLQLLQSMLSEIDRFVSVRIAERPESDKSTPFMSWVVKKMRYDLCGNLRIMINPGDDMLLTEFSELSRQRALLVYGGSDRGIIDQYGTEDRLLGVLARYNPRRMCQKRYLERFCQIQRVSDQPEILSQKFLENLTLAERAFVFRVETILDRDYFLEGDVRIGKISHGLPVLVQSSSRKVTITLDTDGEPASLILTLYDKEFTAFQSMVTDYVRTMIFPRVTAFVPSSSRNGAEAFLRTISRPREAFEYEDTDLGSLPRIWADYQEGLLTISQAVSQSVHAVRRSVQVVDSSGAASVEEVVPDVISNEYALRNSINAQPTKSLEAFPAISRSEISSDALLLTIEDGEPALGGYRCFLSITDTVRKEVGEFFLQPHKTSVVWGGQKVLFVFLHHSERFGLYYDLLTHESLASKASGGPFATCTIFLKDRIYIPVPQAIQGRFIPAVGERKRFEVRHDILRVGG